MKRAVDNSPQLHLLVTGHFHEEASYRTWRPQGTDDWLLIATVSGTGLFTHQNVRVPVSAGDIILIRPNVLHDYQTGSSGHWELLWSHFHPRPHWHDWLSWPEAAPGLMRLSLPEPLWRSVCAALLEMNLRVNSGQRRREELAMSSLEEALLLCDGVNPLAAEAAIDPRIREAIDYLCLNLSSSVSMPELARHCALSVSRLAHLFRDQLGLSPIQFQEQKRIDRACQLLRLTTRPIQTIACELGFRTPYYFSARFHRSTGQSPRAYRKQQSANLSKPSITS